MAPCEWYLIPTLHVVVMGMDAVWPTLFHRECVWLGAKRICPFVRACIRLSSQHVGHHTTCYLLALAQFWRYANKQCYFSHLCVDSHQTGIARSSAVKVFYFWRSRVPSPIAEAWGQRHFWGQSLWQKTKCVPFREVTINLMWPWEVKVRNWSLKI